MTHKEFQQIIEGVRSRKHIDFRELALVRETVDALCQKFGFPSPWTREENCQFIINTIRYWEGYHCGTTTNSK